MEHSGSFSLESSLPKSFFSSFSSGLSLSSTWKPILSSLQENQRVNRLIQVRETKLQELSTNQLLSTHSNLSTYPISEDFPPGESDRLTEILYLSQKNLRVLSFKIGTIPTNLLKAMDLVLEDPYSMSTAQKFECLSAIELLREKLTELVLNSDEILGFFKDIALECEATASSFKSAQDTLLKFADKREEIFVSKEMSRAKIQNLYRLIMNLETWKCRKGVFVEEFDSNSRIKYEDCIKETVEELGKKELELRDLQCFYKKKISALTSKVRGLADGLKRLKHCVEFELYNTWSCLNGQEFSNDPSCLQIIKSLEKYQSGVREKDLWIIRKLCRIKQENFVVKEGCVKEISRIEAFFKLKIEGLIQMIAELQRGKKKVEEEVKEWVRRNVQLEREVKETVESYEGKIFEVKEGHERERKILVEKIKDKVLGVKRENERVKGKMEEMKKVGLRFFGQIFRILQVFKNVELIRKGFSMMRGDCELELGVYVKDVKKVVGNRVGRIFENVNLGIQSVRKEVFEEKEKVRRELKSFWEIFEGIISSFRKIAQDFEEYKKITEEKIIQSNKDIGELIKNNEQLIVKAEAELMKNRKLTEINQKLEEHFNELNIKYQEQNESLSAINEKHEKFNIKYVEQSQILKELTEEHEKIHKLFMKQSEDLKELSDKNKNLTKICEERDENIKKLIKELQELNKTNQDKDENIKKLIEELQELNKSCQEKDENINKLKETHSNLHHKAQEQTETISQLFKANQDHTQTIKNLTEQHQNLTQQHKDLTEQHQNLKKINESQSTHIQELSEKNNSLNVSIDHLNNTVSTLTRTTKDLTQKLSDLESLKNTILEEFNQYKEGSHHQISYKFEDIQKENEELKFQLLAEKILVQETELKLSERYQKSESVYADIHEQHLATIEKLKVLSADQDSKSEEIQKLTLALTNAKEQLENAVITLKDQSCKIENLQSRLARAKLFLPKLKDLQLSLREISDLASRQKSEIFSELKTLIANTYENQSELNSQITSLKQENLLLKSTKISFSTELNSRTVPLEQENIFWQSNEGLLIPDLSSKITSLEQENLILHSKNASLFSELQELKNHKQASFKTGKKDYLAKLMKIKRKISSFAMVLKHEKGVIHCLHRDAFNYIRNALENLRIFIQSYVEGKVENDTKDRIQLLIQNFEEKFSGLQASITNMAQSEELLSSKLKISKETELSLTKQLTKSEETSKALTKLLNSKQKISKETEISLITQLTKSEETSKALTESLQILQSENKALKTQLAASESLNKRLQSPSTRTTPLKHFQNPGNTQSLTDRLQKSLQVLTSFRELNNNLRTSVIKLLKSSTFEIEGFRIKLFDQVKSDIGKIRTSLEHLMENYQEERKMVHEKIGKIKETVEVDREIIEPVKEFLKGNQGSIEALNETFERNSVIAQKSIEENVKKLEDVCSKIEGFRVKGYELLNKYKKDSGEFFEQDSELSEIAVNASLDAGESKDLNLSSVILEDEIKNTSTNNELLKMYNPGIKSCCRLPYLIKSLEKILNNKFKDDLAALEKNREPLSMSDYLVQSLHKESPALLEKKICEFLNSFRENQSDTRVKFYCRLFQVFEPNPISYKLSLYIIKMRHFFNVFIGKQVIPESHKKRVDKMQVTVILKTTRKLFGSDIETGKVVLKNLKPENMISTVWTITCIDYYLYSKSLLPVDCFNLITKQQTLTEDEFVSGLSSVHDTFVNENDLHDLFSSQSTGLMAVEEFCKLFDLDSFFKRNQTYMIDQMQFLNALIEGYTAMRIRHYKEVENLVIKNCGKNQILGKNEVNAVLAELSPSASFDKIFMNVEEVSARDLRKKIFELNLGGKGIGCYNLKSIERISELFEE